MTYREKMAIEHPEKVNPVFMGNVEGCPSDKDEYACCATHGGYDHKRCHDCWNREIPGTESTKKENVTMTPTTKKTKAELLDEIADLKKQVADLERYQKYEEMANELFAIQQTFVPAGSSEEKAFSLLTVTLKMAPKMAR